MISTTERRAEDRGLKRWQAYTAMFVMIMGLIYGVGSWLLTKLYASPIYVETRLSVIEEKTRRIEPLENRVTVLETRFVDSNESIVHELHAINRKLDR